MEQDQDGRLKSYRSRGGGGLGGPGRLFKIEQLEIKRKYFVKIKIQQPFEFFC